MKNAILTFLCVILASSLLLASCDVSDIPADVSENVSVSSEDSFGPSSEEESIDDSSEESSEEPSEEESEEPSEEISLPSDASELYLYAMSVIENSASYTAKTESTYDLFQSDEPEPVLSYTASTEVRLQEVNEHDKRLDFRTSLSVEGLTSESRLLYIDGVGYYDTDGEKIKQAMSFEKALEFLGSDGETVTFTPDMFGSVTIEDLRSGYRIELTKINDVSSASSLIPENMSNGVIEDLRVTLYVNADGSPAAEVIGMRMKVESDHKYIDIYCEVIQTTTFGDIEHTVVKSNVDAKSYEDGIIYKK